MKIRINFWFYLSVPSINTEINTTYIDLLLTCLLFLKGASYSGIRIYNNLPRCITSIRNEKQQFKITLKKFHMLTSFTLWMNFMHVQMICITELYDCVISYIVIILYVFKILTCSTSYCQVTASGICGMYIYIYVCTTHSCTATNLAYVAFK